jgi:glutamate--cysteine ligase
VELVEWADRILSEMRPIAERLDAVSGTEMSSAVGLHCAALDHAIDTLHHPEKLPAARVLASMQNDFGGSFGRFGLAQAQRLKVSAAAAPLSAAQTLAMKAQALQSLHDQAAVEAADSLPFDQYLAQYLSPTRLTPRSAQRRA